ncbi:MAG: methylmalonyl Co-A mutase-associated GTPase MeaB [Bacteroidia bacterium]|nr:methylmalonyl Co-A mutase-associated GTPase MeaB [Bacteroidia bacterium]
MPPIRHPIQTYVAGILAGNRTILSQAITVLESHLSEDQKRAANIIDQILPYSGKSLRLGITGSPGVGKSSFIDVFGNHAIMQGKKVAVLAIDPSSPISGGSILGDKTRMALLSQQANAFIRPSPAGKKLGGTHTATRETILLCEAAGFDLIIVETVGVGQSETEVSSMTDLFLLLIQAGSGDELQGIKKGIVELADYLLVTKADNDNLIRCKRTQADFQQSVHYQQKKSNGITPIVDICSAYTQLGIAEAFQHLYSLHQALIQHNYLSKFRENQYLHWIKEYATQLLLADFDFFLQKKDFSNKQSVRLNATNLLKDFYKTQENTLL